MKNNKIDDQKIETFVNKMTNDLIKKIEQAYEDSIIYGAGYLKMTDGMIENVSPVQFEKEMVQIVETLNKETDNDLSTL